MMLGNFTGLWRREGNKLDMLNMVDIGKRSVPNGGLSG